MPSLQMTLLNLLRLGEFLSSLFNSLTKAVVQTIKVSVCHSNLLTVIKLGITKSPFLSEWHDYFGLKISTTLLGISPFLTLYIYIVMSRNLKKEPATILFRVSRALTPAK